MYDTSGISTFKTGSVFPWPEEKQPAEHISKKDPSITCSWPGSCFCFFSAQIAPRQRMRWCHCCEWHVSSLWSVIIYQPHINVAIDSVFPMIPANLIWLLLAGDLWVSKREGLFCFLFTGSEKENQATQHFSNFNKPEAICRVRVQKWRSKLISKYQLEVLHISAQSSAASGCKVGHFLLPPLPLHPLHHLHRPLHLLRPRPPHRENLTTKSAVITLEIRMLQI